MAVLTNGIRTITVPEATVSDYLADGWSRPGGEPVKKTKPKRSSKTTKKGAPNGVSVRTDGDEGTSEEGPGPV